MLYIKKIAIFVVINCILHVPFEDPDEMQHNAAFYKGLQYLRRFKEPSKDRNPS